MAHSVFEFSHRIQRLHFTQDKVLNDKTFITKVLQKYNVCHKVYINHPILDQNHTRPGFDFKKQKMLHYCNLGKIN